MLLRGLQSCAGREAAHSPALEECSKKIIVELAC